MKKVFALIAIAFSLSASAQKDTTIQVTMNINQFRYLLSQIDKNIDSKSASYPLMEFLQKSAQIVADKPKEEQPKPKK